MFILQIFDNEKEHAVLFDLLTLVQVTRYNRLRKCIKIRKKQDALFFDTLCVCKLYYLL